MLKNLWNKLKGEKTEHVVEREGDEEQMSSEERQFVDESVEGHKTDTFVEEHGMAGLPPVDVDDHPPRY
jgi:hypothetical protein